VNDEKHPLYINSPQFTGYLVVRLSTFTGVTPDLEQENVHKPIKVPESNYFQGRNRKYSIMVQGRFKSEFHGDEIMFGADFDSPITPPPGTGMAIRIAKWLDPAIIAQVDSEASFMFSPIVSAMNSLAIYPHNDPFLVDDTETIPQNKISVGKSDPLHIGNWKFSSKMIQENPTLLFNTLQDKTYITTYDKRKKHFSNVDSRRQVILHPDNVYCMDFYDAYFDMNAVQVKLPGFSFNAFKFWDGKQKLRYACVSRDKSIVFFVIQFELVRKEEYGLE
jgi:hypothetical protein